MGVSSRAQLTIDTLRLVNAHIHPSPFLDLRAFNASKLRLTSVYIRTDCYALNALANASSSNGAVGVVRGPAHLFIERYTSATVNATNVNITCDLPALEHRGTADGDAVTVADGEGFFNALFSNLTSTDPLVITATGNLTLSSALWNRAFGGPLPVQRNVTLRGDPSTLNILDFGGIVSAVELAPNVEFGISNFYLFNLAQLRGELVDLGMLPLFSVPLGVAPNRNSITLERMVGTGLDLYNASITAMPPAPGLTSVVLDNPNLQFSLDVFPGFTQLPVYSLADLMAVLQAVQDTRPATNTALFVLRNITIDPAVWPAGGYNLSTPLLLAGQSNMGVLTWIDFRRVPGFVNVFGCPPSMYVYVQGLHLLNLPNGMLQPAGQPDGSAPPGSAARAGLDDVSIYLSNIRKMDTTCGTTVLYTNQSSIAVTYAEYQRVYAEVAKSFSTGGVLDATAVGHNFTYNLMSLVFDDIRFTTLLGWGWSGFRVNITYIFPPDVPVMYHNFFQPPSPPLPPGGNAVPRSGGKSSGSLLGWHVALIVLGAVAVVAVVAGLIAWRIVSRLRREVDAVKSGSYDKRSSGPSTETTDPATAANGNGNGARLGSSGRDNGGELEPGSPAAPKGALAGGGGGGGGEPGGSGARPGTSDDSTLGAAGADRLPLDLLNNMMSTLAREMNDQHLTILEVIGQGGFGVVYKGQWKGLNVAVKTITFQDRVAGGEKAQHRAILEAAISSSLSHPNVVTTYSYDIKPLTVQDSSSGDSPSCSGMGTPGTPGAGGLRIIDKRTVLDWKLYLIQEYCDGGSLRTAILKRKFHDTKRAEPRTEMLLDTALELAGGLVHLHERNIIHGDLNPNNVLLKRDPSRKYGAICKIADFGLSIRMNADQSHISNMRRGTPFYTCPQILSRGNMTKAADVYSMGVMMWEMYHCCMSYRSLANGFAARENFPHFPRKAPYDFAQIVAACLDPEPSARPTFAQLRAALETQLALLKRGELRTGEQVMGPDPAGDSAHLAACLD
ncbi:hypothetical protein GPECTOR_26g536 [Gonium pectorale]|uniref:Protein kinase domain-containing protein n=1 Tax=Gonium pectorale TaxID=33097 RepID=A0A150GFS3_GONPE|nr:hypothetical protein GPECTOR_26g536 [Gonium pectorale]|eukprot:KXZ48633.1 hypothetical protein GPECTOR_26g536 [Gonium pectorale]